MAKRKTAKKTTKKSSNLGLGLVIAGAAAAAGAGAYYLYGPDKKKHRKKVHGWMLKASGEVMDKVEKLKEIDKDKYEAILEQMEAKYQKVKDMFHSCVLELHLHIFDSAQKHDML